jgi:maltose alpha-D-glucosyltransferase/alpha-amylase
VRLHDELNLDRLSEQGQEEVFAAFAPDEEMRLFGRGLRGRLAPMVHGDQRRLELAYSMVFSLPGTPMVFYGEEIGMGDNRDLHARMAVRTPMQWAADESGGFSTAPPDRLVRPLVHDADYAPAAVNVTHQRRQHDSLLNRVRQIMEARRETPSIGLGNFEMLDSGDSAVFAHRATWEEKCLLALHNFSAQEREVVVPNLDGFPRSAVVLGDAGDRDVEGVPEKVQLAPYGYCWIRATKDSSRALL